MGRWLVLKPPPRGVCFPKDVANRHTVLQGRLSTIVELRAGRYQPPALTDLHPDLAVCCRHPLNAAGQRYPLNAATADAEGRGLAKQNLLQRSGGAVLMVTHSEGAKDYTDRILHLEAGRIA